MTNDEIQAMKETRMQARTDRMKTPNTKIQTPKKGVARLLAARPARRGSRSDGGVAARMKTPRTTKRKETT